MARPRAGDWMEDEFKGLAALGIVHVISLLGTKEAQARGLADEGSFCRAAGMFFHSFPIPDRGVPISAQSLSRLACDTYHRCAEGESTVIHCRAGIGRAGLVSSAVLLHCGFTAYDALGAVSTARKLQVPDTKEQIHWLESNSHMVAQSHIEPIESHKPKM